MTDRDDDTKVTPPPFPPKFKESEGSGLKAQLDELDVDRLRRIEAQHLTAQVAENNRFKAKREAISKILDIFQEITLTQDRYSVLRAVRSFFDE